MQISELCLLLNIHIIHAHAQYFAASTLNIDILAVVSVKFPGFCKCLRFSKSGFDIFFNSAGCQKQPALSANDRWSVMMMAKTIKSILILLLTSIL